ncbi:Abi family protein [Enterococcus hulanensis]|uniref:Abi family protein n=1 Tax=Enterococcus hulanensis TaxID=2559929 RepID=A0ABU3F0K3_9ENTE|nr:Abi family protein [Enterococcus hulanensis]MDT2600656.1 Abi family protein [Enterococcus hulanensis]MDT2610179.1 Abi family protein [Enterococcus hulanensis]MDT2617413.1 Abi family protein [Enterococcus hulanensis]MDT2628124.1 Abi family protein [Enterococcus hulanensis]MDT2655229.1 Abi family protein [Enterococcus hulanensis]
MTPILGESLEDNVRHQISGMIETDSQKRFKTNHPKLTPKQLIKKMRSKGIEFKLISEKDARDRISFNTYYFKVGVYRYNFDKGEDNKYVDLDFAYLDDLAIIDMRLRKILLNMSLDLEHSLKTLLNSVITKNRDEDGYQIVQDFSQKYKFDLNEIYDQYRKNLHYLKPIKDKHSDCTSVWVLLELMSFGDLAKFLEFYYERATILKKKFSYPAKLIRYAKNVRNAAAHNNPILVNLRGRNISPDPKIIQESSKIGLKAELYRNPRINDLLCLFFLHNMYCSQGVKDHLIDELKIFRERCKKNPHYYQKNSHLLDIYEGLNLLIDYYENK